MPTGLHRAPQDRRAAIARAPATACRFVETWGRVKIPQRVGERVRASRLRAGRTSLRRERENLPARGRRLRYRRGGIRRECVRRSSSRLRVERERKQTISARSAQRHVAVRSGELNHRLCQCVQIANARAANLASCSASSDAHAAEFAEFRAHGLVAPPMSVRIPSISVLR
jgi:hypothetical protein